MDFGALDWGWGCGASQLGCGSGDGCNFFGRDVVRNSRGQRSLWHGRSSRRRGRGIPFYGWLVEIAEAFALRGGVGWIGFRIFLFRLAGWNAQARFPSAIGVAEFFAFGFLVDRGDGLGESSLLVRLCAGDDLVFELRESGEQLARFERLHDK